MSQLESEMEKKEMIKRLTNKERIWDFGYRVLQAPKNEDKKVRNMTRFRNKKRLRSMKKKSELYLENHFHESYGV